MISCDTSILFPACDTGSPHYQQARQFLQSMSASAEFCLCEQVLMELYCLLRNPTVCRRPLAAGEAAATIQSFRSNSRWRIVDVPTDVTLMASVWRIASGTSFAYRRIFDVRLALTLQHHGVREFATRNQRDFSDLGFARVWDPMA